MDRNRIIMILLVAAALVSGLWFFGGQSAAQGRPNLLLITLDTTRADRIGCYGYAQALTPALDDLARRGVAFDQAIANAPLTLPSHATMLTGLLPPEHGLRVNGHGCLPDDVTTMAEALKEAGYQTGAFIGAFVLDRRHELSRGFEAYDDDMSAAYEHHEDTVLTEYRGGNLVVDSALKWLGGANQERPFFCWVHLYDPHHPYYPHEALAGTRFANHATYDSEIAFVDTQVKRLVDFLQARRLTASTLIAAIGDHGESLGQHGEDEHGYLLYEATLRVPMIFAMPEKIQAGRRVPALVSLADVFPTILDVLEVPRDVECSGRSLAAALAGYEVESMPVYSETYMPFSSFGWSPLCSVTTPDWKYIRCSSTPRLFNRASDPAELRTIAAANPEKLDELSGQLDSLEAGLTRRNAELVEATPEADEKLRALGYVGGNEKALQAEKIDFTLYRDIEEVLPALAMHSEMRRFKREGNIAEFKKVAHALLQIVEVDRCRLMLGETLVDAGELDEGAQEIEKYLASNPKDTTARYNLGLAFEKAGRHSEAEQQYVRILDVDEDDVQTLNKLGQLLQAQGRLDDALVRYKKAVEIKDEGLTHHNLALIYENKGDFENALKHYQDARAKDSAYVDVPQDMETLLIRNGRLSEAVRVLQEELKASPNEHNKRLSLATAYEKMEEFEKAAALATELMQSAPDDARCFLLLGIIRGKQQRSDEAENLLRKALELDSDNVNVLNNLGLIVGRRGDFAAAHDLFLKAVDIEPASHIANRNLGDSFFREGKWEDAAKHYLAAIRAEPKDGVARMCYGQTLGELGRLREAAQAYGEAVRILPNDGRAWLYYGVTSEAAGEVADAVNAYRKVLEIHPEEVKVLNNLAWLLATHPDDRIRNGDEAIQHAYKASQLQGHADVGILDTLAAANAEASEFQEAIDIASRAIELAGADSELLQVEANKLRMKGDEAGAGEAEREADEIAELAEEIRARLELYKRQEPYRQIPEAAQSEGPSGG